jgi:hypothetical protein
MHSFASIFMCFYCVFTAETCTFGTLYIFTKKHMNHVLYMKYTVLLVFSCVLLCFHCRNMYFWYMSHVYTKIHMYYIFYMKLKVLLLFSCVFTLITLQKHVVLVHFTCLHQNTHEPYILHEMHSFASVFMCFHCDFTAKTCIFGTLHMFLPKYTYTIYSTWNAQFC